MGKRFDQQLAMGSPLFLEIVRMSVLAVANEVANDVARHEYARTTAKAIANDQNEAIRFGRRFAFLCLENPTILAVVVKNGALSNQIAAELTDTMVDTEVAAHWDHVSNVPDA